MRRRSMLVGARDGLTPHVPGPQRGSSVSDGFFRKDEFYYDPERDAYICPAGLGGLSVFTGNSLTRQRSHARPTR